jgi:hypothetical protein
MSSTARIVLALMAAIGTSTGVAVVVVVSESSVELTRESR